MPVHRQVNPQVRTDPEDENDQTIDSRSLGPVLLVEYFDEVLVVRGIAQVRAPGKPGTPHSKSNRDRNDLLGS